MLRGRMAPMSTNACVATVRSSTQALSVTRAAKFNRPSGPTITQSKLAAKWARAPRPSPPGANDSAVAADDRKSVRAKNRSTDRTTWCGAMADVTTMVFTRRTTMAVMRNPENPSGRRLRPRLRRNFFSNTMPGTADGQSASAAWNALLSCVTSMSARMEEL